MRLAAILFGLACSLWAQSPLSTVTGLALDPSGSAVPGVRVLLVNQATSIRLETTTNSSGNYLLTNLPPGLYKLSAEAKGFRPLEVERLTLEAFRTVRQDLRFDLASSSSEVTVAESASPVVQSETPSVQLGLSQQQIIELPSNLRSVYNNSGDSGLIANLMPLAVPGVVQMGSGAYWMAPGSGPNGMRVKVDGIETTFGNFGSPDPVSQPSMESVEEFTANLVTNRAEFGGMATVTTVTRSGGNRYHGDLFWYGKNAALDARNPFLTARSFQNIHDYGFSFGGPLRKDKTFLFTTFEQIRGVRGYPFTSSVPTIDQRAGLFSAAVKDPYASGAPFADNRIPLSRIAGEALKAQTLLYPLPNYGSAALTAGNYRASFNGPETHHLFESRVDHNFSSTQSAFLRYQFKRDDYDIPGARGTLPPTTEGTSANLRQLNFFSIGHVWTVSPSSFNEFRGGLVQLESKSSADVKGQPLLDQIGVSGLPPRPGAPGVPNFAVTGLSTFTQSLLNPVVDGHFQFSDNFTHIASRHTLKFGAEFVRWFVNKHVTSNSGLFGNFSFQNRYSGQPYGDFLLGLPTTVTRMDPWAAQYFRWSDVAFYAQDDFKLNARLSLNYGIRYEYNQPAWARDDNFYNFDTATGAAILPTSGARQLASAYYPANLPLEYGDSLGFNRSLRRADTNNWAPRAGFSYRLDNAGKTVVRGGAGVYYGHYSAGALSGQVAGPFAVSTTANNAFSGATPLFTLARPFATPGSAGTLNLNGVSPDLKHMYAYEYSLTLERELARDFGLRLSYIGTSGRQLPYMFNFNQPRASTVAFAQARRPFPIYNNVVFAQNGANSSYQGLQTGVQKRFSRGLQFTSTWIWAKELSEVDDTNNAEINTQIEDAYNRRRDRANVYSVPRHQWQNQALYELPFGQGKLRGGWQVNALINFSTGHWLNALFSGSDTSNTNTVGGRPDVVSALNYPKTLAAWFDRTAFALPQNGTFGNAARNLIQGPGYTVFNAGLMKKVRFERAGEVQIGLSFQNALNHANYGPPNMTVNNVNGGVVTSTHTFLPAGSPRQGQLNLRWKF